MKYCILLILISIVSCQTFSAGYDFLGGNVPEDIYLEMKKRECTIIPSFYAMERGDGGERIGAPYADGFAYKNDHKRAVTVFGCKLLQPSNGFDYKLIILYSDKKKSNRDYSCTKNKPTDICPALPSRVYENYDDCSHEIFLSEKPAGMAIRALDEKNENNLEFTDTTDMGSTGTLYSCSKGKWVEDSLH